MVTIDREKYVANDDEDFATIPDTNDWIAQTFTVGTVVTDVAFTLDSIDVKLTENGSGETVTFEIYELRPDGSPKCPNGAADRLSYGTIDETDWTDTDWVNITMSSVVLQQSKSYALVMRATGASATWRADGTAPSYAGGSVWVSADTGATWTEDATTDFMFQLNTATQDGTLCTVGEAVNKAGAGASAVATDHVLVGQFIKQAESRICAATEYNWIDNYSTLNADVKYTLNEVTSDIAAVYIINYDDSGYSSGLEYERKINILKVEINQLIKILTDMNKADFIKNE